MNARLSAIAAGMQTAAQSYIPKAYQLGREKAQSKYGTVVPWSDADNVNVELLLNRHAQELEASMVTLELQAAEGKPVQDLIKRLINRAASWAWVLSPALAMGLAAYINAARNEIGRAEGLEPNDIGIIWLTAEDEKVCKKCLYLAGRWFPAKQAYEIASTIHIGCRCSRFFDVGIPSEAMVGPIPGYKPGTADDVYRNLGADTISGLAQERINRARRLNIRRGKLPNER